MAWLTLNGIELASIAALDSDPRGDHRDVGSQNEASDGSLSITRQVRKRDFKFGTVPLSGSDAFAWESLITGVGHNWSFDVSLYSSKGFAPASGGSTFGGYSLASTSPAPKYGAKYLKLVDSGAGAAVGYQLGYDAYTFACWRYEQAPLEFGSSWHHYVVRSDGAKWFDGFRDDSKDTSDWLAISDGLFQVFELSGETHGIDDMQICPFLWLDDWATQVLFAGVAFGLTPFLVAAGDLVPEAATRQMVCAGCSETYLMANLGDGEGMQNDLRRLAVELKAR